MHLRTAFLFAVTLTVSSVAAVVEPVDSKENPLTEKNEPRSSPTEIPALNEPLPTKAAGDAPVAANPALPVENFQRPVVRVDVLMVSLFEEKALPLLAQLRDPTQIVAAEQALLVLIAKKEAILEGWPEVTTYSGNRAVSEAIVEARYPTKFLDPDRDAKREKSAASLLVSGVMAPSEFETRNVGSTLEVEPIVSPDGTMVSLQLAPQLVRLERYAEFETGVRPANQKPVVTQPIFATNKVSLSLSLKDGERRLIHVGKSGEQKTRIDLFILGVKVHAQE